MAELPLNTGIPRFKSNEDRFDRFVNGTDTQSWTTSGAASVPTIRKFLKDKNDEIDGTITDVFDARDASVAAATAAATARDESVSAKDASVAAKDAALVAKAAVEAAVPPAGSQNSILVGQSDGTYDSLSRDATVAALLLMGVEKAKMYLEGLRPDRFSDTIIRVQPGACADGSVVPSDIMVLTAALDINLTTTGLNALDTGTITLGTDYFIYMLKNPTTGQVGAVISEQIATSLVTKPAGFTLIRKLPWGFIYRAGGSTGIPTFHLSHWSHPTTFYTDMDDSAGWAALVGGTATTLTTVDLSSFIPDNARWIHLMVRLQGTVDGKAYLRTSGSGGNGKPAGEIKANGVDVVYLSVRVTSAAAVSYRVTSANCSVSIYVVGYDQTEVS